MSDTQARIASVIRDHLGIDITGYADPLALTVMGDLGADSIDIVELTMAIEDEFEEELLDDEVDALFGAPGRTGTIGDLCNLVDSKRQPTTSKALA